MLPCQAPIELRTPGSARRWDAEFWACPVSSSSCGWLTVNAANQSTMSVSSAGDLVLPLAARAVDAPAYAVQYLQADWPVPFIYLQGSGDPGLPAAPFKLTVASENAA